MRRNTTKDTQKNVWQDADDQRCGNSECDSQTSGLRD
jgi:hypothetical protein